MKKIVTLMLAAGLMFSAVNSASALDVNIGGSFDFSFEGYGNLDTPFESSKNWTHNRVQKYVNPADAPRAIYNGDNEWVNSAALSGNYSHQKHGGAVQRIRLGMDFIMSESLSAHYEIQVGTFTWGGSNARNTTLGGNKAVGGQTGGHATNVATHLAYLDWMVPSTDIRVRMGLQRFDLPSYTFGSPVLGNRGTGIAVSIPVNENITVTPVWVRVDSEYRRDYENTSWKSDDLRDVIALMTEFRYDGFRVSPWAAFVSAGKDASSTGNQLPFWGSSKPFAAYGFGFGGANWAGNSLSARQMEGTKSGKAWFAGISGELTMFDPFRFTADFVYGAAYSGKFTRTETYTNVAGDLYDVQQKYSMNRKGWYAALGAEYNLPQYGVLGLKGWYASGDDKKTSNGSERLPVISGGFNATNGYFDNAYGVSKGIGRATADGTWGIQLSWNNISFIDKLSHNLSVSYIRGTNSDKLIRSEQMAGMRFFGEAGGLHPSNYLTKKDSMIEIDLRNTYNIYQNLAAVLELSYIIEDFSGATWGRYLGGGTWNDGATTLTPVKAKFNDLWRASLNFSYTF